MPFNRLSISSEMKCQDCESFKSVYLDTKYFETMGLVTEDIVFTETLLKDFEEHIKEKHPERAKYFLNGDIQ